MRVAHENHKDNDATQYSIPLGQITKSRISTLSLLGVTQFYVLAGPSVSLVSGIQFVTATTLALPTTVSTVRDPNRRNALANSPIGDPPRRT